ncbi:cytochrome P450-dit2 [Steccherinum ochraceum]|uniref:Cytochrome P450-dit2 n=1 Tax=Steccherinum ochraceum TaxID=92696 RepID=A0A4R0RL54_9APHY|nr:cytochrome P450-dit2 [Steccherinum ochraceum]
MEVTVWQASTNILLAAGAYVVFKKLTHRVKEGTFEDVDGPPRDSWVTGSFHRVFKDGFDYVMHNVQKYGGVLKFAMPFFHEALLISDPLAIQHILIKEQESFEVTEIFRSGSYLAFGPGLFATTGPQHRKQRKLLNPAFATAHMQEMLPATQPIASKLCSSITSQVTSAGGQAEVDVLSWMSRTSIEYIGQGGMGYSFDSLDAPSNNPQTSTYIQALNKMVPLNMRIRWLALIVPYVLRMCSAPVRTFLVDWLPISALKEMRECVYVMWDTSTRILADRKKDLEREVEAEGFEKDEKDGWAKAIRGKDIMSLLLKANAGVGAADKLADEEVISQIAMLLFAGFESTSGVISRLLHIFSLDDRVQCRLRSEIRRAKQDHAGVSTGWEEVELPFDVLFSLPYLDAIYRESLRLYPAVAALSRVAQNDTVLPLSEPIRGKSGAQTKSIAIRKGTIISISLLGSNYNKAVWGDDAFEFKPERWLGEGVRGVKAGTGTAPNQPGKVVDEFAEAYRGNQNQSTTTSSSGSVKYPGIYSSIMSFGGGPRACIGFRFAEMEVKQVLVTLLSTLHFSLSPEKEVRWMSNNFQTPVVKPPGGDGKTRQVPLMVRRVVEGDFLDDARRPVVPLRPLIHHWLMYDNFQGEQIVMNMRLNDERDEVIFIATHYTKDAYTKRWKLKSSYKKPSPKSPKSMNLVRWLRGHGYALESPGTRFYMLPPCAQLRGEPPIPDGPGVDEEEDLEGPEAEEVARIAEEHERQAQAQADDDDDDE